MHLFTDVFDTRDCIRLYQYIRIIENIYYFKKIQKSNLLSIDNNKFRINENISYHNNQYKSLHNINNYQKIKDLLIKFYSNVKSVNSDLHITDVFVKKWYNLESNIDYNLNTGENYNMFAVKNSAVQSVNYKFHDYTALFFTEKCQIFYDSLDSKKFDNKIICPRGSILFLEKEHFVVKNLALFYSIGLGFSKSVSIIDTIINTDKRKEDRYSDLEML